jgi:hypothetical protein
VPPTHGGYTYLQTLSGEKRSQYLVPPHRDAEWWMLYALTREGSLTEIQRHTAAPKP